MLFHFNLKMNKCGSHMRKWGGMGLAPARVGRRWSEAVPVVKGGDPVTTIVPI